MNWNFQDKLFEECCEYQEFRHYITGIDDLEKHSRKQLVLDNFDRIMMDSLFLSKSLNILVIIEHQSSITNEIMARNLKYPVNTRHKFKKPVQLHIFHTGLRIAPKKYVYDNQIFHIPFLHQTFEKNGMETFKKIKNKIRKYKTTPYDIFDLIWLPRFGEIEINDDFLIEYIESVSCLKDNNFYNLLKMATVSWVDCLSENEEIIDYLKEKLDMMDLNSPEFRELRATAIYEKTVEKLEEMSLKLKEQNITIKEKDMKIKELEKRLANVEGSK